MTLITKNYKLYWVSSIKKYRISEIRTWTMFEKQKYFIIH